MGKLFGIEIDITEATDRWVDWEKGGGRFKEWIRAMDIEADAYGWLGIPWSETCRFFENVWRVLTWIPFLWDDRDWDYSAVLVMQREKLRRLRVHIATHQIIVDADNVAHDIAIAEAVLTRLIDADYCSEEFSAHFDKYPMVWKEREDGMSELQSTPKEAHAESTRLRDKEEYLWQQDMKFLGEHYRKKIRNWWD